MARGAVRLDVPARTSECRECGATLHDYRISGRMPERCRPCKLAAKSAYQARTSPPKLVITDTCIDCGVSYERSSRATTRVRCEPCRDQYRVSQKREYAAERPEVAKAARRRWVLAHPDYVWNSAHHRRVIERSSAEKIERSEVFARDGWTCHLCGLEVDRNLKFPHPESASIDHVIPVALGGDHSRANVRLAHLVCNQRKGARCG